MNRILTVKLALVVFLLPFHEGLSQSTLDAKASDPNKMGWMYGFPPPAEKVISAADGSFFQFPALRYSVCHMRQFLPTTEVKAAQAKHYQLKAKTKKGIDSLTFVPLGSQEPMTWEASLYKNYTDGIIILHKGKVIYERYFGALTPNGVHAAMSVSKTLTGTLGAMLVAEGVLDENKPAVFYVPELKGSGFSDATIREILDMTTAIQFSEDYANPKAEIWLFGKAGNPFPKEAGYAGPNNYFDYLKTVQKDGQHGQVFAYKTVNTDVMGWIISRVTGKSIPVLLSERIWQPLGTRYDGYYQVDGAGIAFAGGGFSGNLRDLALFGEMIRNRGYFNGQQVLPASVVDNIMRGGERSAFDQSLYHKQHKGWSYRDMWWVTHNRNGAFAARGVHGQTIYIDPAAEMVIVRFASHPVAGNAANDPYSLPAYQAIADYLQ
ncbi:serine hydrolase domain-containing protein [Carboxylicivirga taeanensis]|uniref:serine hydrolase domain-containing protein n=1 Tax=Carboxylicivirga taeanensis TaxID=1416875 RepID=UPI003F6E2BCF